MQCKLAWSKRERDSTFCCVLVCQTLHAIIRVSIHSVLTRSLKLLLVIFLQMLSMPYTNDINGQQA